MNRRMFSAFTFGLLALPAAAGAQSAKAEGSSVHRVAIQVSSDDHKTQKLALANARNFASLYKAKGEEFAIQVVAYGPGYEMLQEGVSSEKDAIAGLMRDFGNAVTFSACQNTRKAFAKAKGVSPDQIAELPGVADTDSGVVLLVELQQKGWGYIRP